MSTNYPDTQLFLDGEWRDALAKENLEIINPATEEVIGKVSHARKEDLDIALTAAEKAFNNNWNGVIVNGCIRDSDIIKNIDIGVLALSTNPQKSEKKDVGEVNIELNFFNTSFTPGHYLYADLDGLLVSKTKIDI